MPMVLLVVLCLAGCPSRAKPSDDVATVGSDDGTNPNNSKLGQIEFAGPADTEVNIRDASGKIVYTGETPFSVRLPAGAFTWSARFVDNQRTEDRSLAVMPGDDSRVEVTPARGSGVTDDTEGAKNAPLGESKKDFNKPWVSTEPLIPVGPGAKVGAPKAGPTKGEKSTEPPPAGGTTGAEGQGLTPSGDSANSGPADPSKPGARAPTPTDE